MDSAGHPTNEESSSGSNNSARRSTMKPMTGPQPNKRSASLTTAEKRQLELQYGTKKTRYANLKKTLAEKQVINNRTKNVPKKVAKVSSSR